MHCRCGGGAGCGWRMWGAPPRNEGSSSGVLEPLVPGSARETPWGPGAVLGLPAVHLGREGLA